MSLVYDDIDCEAVHGAVADEPPHSDGNAAIDGANGSKASLERPVAFLGGRCGPADGAHQFDIFLHGRKALDELHAADDRG
jgi:hypothetical protein